jgi:hypothetical protein
VTSLPLSPAHSENASDHLASMHNRLRRARLLAGFATAKAAIARFGWKASTYRAHENGQNSFRPAEAFIYARAFKVSPTWLLVGDYGEHAMHEDVPTTDDVSAHDPHSDATHFAVAGTCATREDQFDLTVDVDTLTDVAHSGDIVRFSPLTEHAVLSDGAIVAVEQPTPYGADLCIRRVFFRDGLTLFTPNNIAQAKPLPHARIAGAATWLLRRLAS